MNTQDVLDPKSWAERTFGSVQLHDMRRKISGVGHIGNERGRGFFVQTVLAVRPETQEVLGCLAQEPFVRIPAPEGEQRHQRLKREKRETDVWIRQVHSIGTPDPGSMWVHVGDRGADMFPFFPACQATQTHFLVRAAQNRRVQGNEDELMSSLTRTRAFPSQASRPFEVPARHGHQARSTQLQLAFGQMTLLPPRNEPRASKDPVTVWVIRVWEEQARDAEEPLEWILLTSVPTTTLEQAWERVDWYRHRWLVEDYHQCLTSGCRIEERQGPPVDGLMRRLGSVVASCRAAVRRFVRPLVKTQSVLPMR